jgi:hypothetical protein
MVTVITFYTPEYKEEAMELVKTCNNFQLQVKAYPKESKGSWVHNCTMKAEVIEQALHECQGGVIWVDADGRFRNKPELFDKLGDYDFGCYWIPNVWNQPKNAHLKPWNLGNEALAGGTMYFNNTPLARSLINTWKVESRNNPNRWEQQSLQKVWESYDKMGLRTFNFPQSYCKVFDCKWFEPETSVIVEHMQASRKLKAKVGR